MSLIIRSLIVGGGGGGGSNTGSSFNGGGGGGGEVIDQSGIVVTPGNYTITIGLAGSGGLPPTLATNGTDSSAFGYTAGGGGSGANNSSNGNDGANGGGGSGSSSGSFPGGNATSISGHNGGAGFSSTTNNRSGGGGGSTNAAGSNGGSTVGGNGADGVLSDISGSSVRYGAGGGGAGHTTPGNGGNGGGGHGGYSSGGSTAGTDGFGGGGGGYGNNTAGSIGGKGVVIISYVTADFGICTGGVKTTNGANTVHTFTSDGTFTVVPPFSLETLVVDDISFNTATANGELASDGGDTITERGFVWSTTINPTTSDNKVIVAGTTGIYDGSMTSLSPSVFYYVRAYAINGAGTHYGENVTFTTLKIVDIDTLDATEIHKTSAVGNGEVISTLQTITERGFVWGSSPNPTTAGDKVIVAGTTGEYNGEMSTLIPGDTYYYRAYAITAGGTSYGENITFTTIGLYARIGAMDTGYTDFDESIYFEMIDRWRSYTDLYAKVKSISGLNMYTENAAGTRVYFQEQKVPPNVWQDIDSITSDNNSLFPNAQTDDFEVGRLRIAGFSSGTPIVFHSMEILSINIKGFESN